MSIPLEIQRHDWRKLRAQEGNALSIPSSLVRLANASSEKEAYEAYWKIDNHVVTQGALFESSVATASSAVALLPRSSKIARQWLLELLLQLGNGKTAPSEMEHGAGDLSKACMAEVLRGVAFYFDVIEEGSKDERFLCVDLIGLCALEDESLRKRALWVFETLARKEADDRLQEFMREWIQEIHS